MWFDAVRLSREGPRPVARNFPTVGPSSSRTYREMHYGIANTSELLEDEKHRQRDSTRRVLSRCLCCESESAIVPGLGHMHEPVRDLMRSTALLARQRRCPTGKKQPSEKASNTIL